MNEWGLMEFYKGEETPGRPCGFKLIVMIIWAGGERTGTQPENVRIDLTLLVEEGTAHNQFWSFKSLPKNESFCCPRQFSLAGLFHYFWVLICLCG